VCEPFLVRAGMVARTPRGRVATAQAWTHLGMTPPVGFAGLGIGAPPGCGEPGLFD
jgi:Holliday junction DNA helicase RuvB